MQMKEAKVAHYDEVQNIEESIADIKPFVDLDAVRQVDKEETMDPATTNPSCPHGGSNVVEPAMKTDKITSDSGGDDEKKHVGCQSEDDSGTDPQFSEPSIIKDQETEPVESLDHKCEITTSRVSEVAQESNRGFSGFDLNEEFCSEEQPECSLSGTDDTSKQRLVCLDIDLNVSDDNEDEDVIISCSSSSSSSSNHSAMKEFDLNFNLHNAASLDHRKDVISLFGTQVEVNHIDSFAPFLVMNMAGGSYFGPTVVGPLQENTGLNLELTINAGNNGGLSGSVVGRKRQEPEGGWEAFPVNYKHQHPPWK